MDRNEARSASQWIETEITYESTMCAACVLQEELFPILSRVSTESVVNAREVNALMDQNPD